MVRLCKVDGRRCVALDHYERRTDSASRRLSAACLLVAVFGVEVSVGYDICRRNVVLVSAGSGSVESPDLRRDDGSRIYPTNIDCSTTLQMPSDFAGEILVSVATLQLRGCSWRWSGLSYQCPDYIQFNNGDRLCSCTQRALPEKRSNTFYGNVTIAFRTTPSDSSDRGVGFTVDYTVRGCDASSLASEGRQVVRIVPGGKPSESSMATVICSPGLHVWDAVRRANVTSVSGIECDFETNSWKRTPVCASKGQPFGEQAVDNKLTRIIAGTVAGVVGVAIVITAVSVVAAKRGRRRRRTIIEANGTVRTVAPSTYSHLEVPIDDHIYVEMGGDLEPSKNWQGTLEIAPSAPFPLPRTGQH